MIIIQKELTKLFLIRVKYSKYEVGEHIFEHVYNNLFSIHNVRVFLKQYAEENIL